MMEIRRDLNDFYLKIEPLAGALGKRKHTVVIDVYESSASLDNGGIRSFWDADIPHKRVLKSFKMLGESEMLSLLEEGRRLLSNRDDYADEEVLRIDSKLWELTENIPERLWSYATEHRLI